MEKFDITPYLDYDGLGSEREAKKASKLNQTINDTLDTIISYKGENRDVDQLIDLYIKELLDIYKEKKRTVKEIRTFQLGWDDWRYKFLKSDVFITLLDNIHVKEGDSKYVRDYKMGYKKNTILPYFEDNFKKSLEEAEELKLFWNDYFKNPRDKRFWYMTKANKGPRGLEMSIESYAEQVRKMSLSKEDKWREDYKWELESLQQLLTDVSDKMRRYGNRLKDTQNKVSAIYNEANWDRLTEEEAELEAQKLWKDIDKSMKNIKELSSLLDGSEKKLENFKLLKDRPFNEKESYELMDSLVSYRMDVNDKNRGIFGKNLPLIG